MGLFKPTQLDKAEQWPCYAKNVLSLSSARRARLSTDYTALSTSDKAQLEHLKASGYRLVNWLSEK